MCDFTTCIFTNQISLFLPSQIFVNCYSQVFLFADRLNGVYPFIVTAMLRFSYCCFILDNGNMIQE